MSACHVSFFRKTGRASISESQVATAYLPSLVRNTGLRSVSRWLSFSHFIPLYRPHARSPKCYGWEQAHSQCPFSGIFSSLLSLSRIQSSQRKCSPTPGLWRDELSSGWVPSRIYLMFACRWNTAFKGCGWMNAKENYAQGLCEMIGSIFDFFFNEGFYDLFFFLMVNSV